MHKRPLSDPAHLSRLLIAACLAYLWVVYLGDCARRDDWLAAIHRPDRCDLSLFRLGLRLLARCLKDDLPIPEGFLVPAVAHRSAAARRRSRPTQPRLHGLYGSEVAQNIDEIGRFAREECEATLGELLRIYNQRVRSVETDQALLIELPANL